MIPRVNLYLLVVGCINHSLTLIFENLMSKFGQPNMEPTTELRRVKKTGDGGSTNNRTLGNQGPLQ